MPGLLGKKIGMTSVFSADGKNVPCTVIEAGPCVVTQIKTVETDGYAAVQVGFQTKTDKHTSKAEAGHFKAAGVTPQRHLVEFKEFEQEFSLGAVITVDHLFEADTFVDVIGTSKGKGFQGVIKRHGQSRGPMGHGSMYHRRPGSMGPTSTPGRVFKGKKLPGHMGHVTVTIQNLDVVKVDMDKNVILVKGSVPGAKGAILKLKSAVKAQ